MSQAAEAIAKNIEIHNSIADEYEARHGEIFNPIEQEGLRRRLAAAAASLPAGMRRTALDFGCGTGNVTGQLLALGFRVIAADVAEAFLHAVHARYGADRVAVLRLNGADLREIADESFDLVAAYSVLHHIPDYVKAVAEMARVTQRGGVVYLDHEANEALWQPSAEYQRFRREARHLSPWQRLIKSLRARLRRESDKPRHEGDIHVHAEDHVEWDKVRTALAASGCEVLWEEDYLLFKTKYRREVWERYRHRLADYRCLVAQKCAVHG